MTKPIIFMFSGQGSQYYQMGQTLFRENPLFKFWMQKMDSLCQDLIGVSILAELYQEEHKKDIPFTRMLLTHPAIFMVQYALAQVLISQGIRPTYVLGTSLGEMTAATVSGILSFETALQMVIKQAQLIEEKCKTGNMLAIFQSPTYYHRHLFLKNNSELAAVNFSSHFVVSEEKEKITKVETYLKEEHIDYQALPVNYGFHSSSMDKVAFDYLQFVEQQTLKSPLIPLISCLDAKILTGGSSTYFWEIIRNPIQFQATIQALENENHYSYVDVGPSGTLATFVKYNLTPLSQSKILTTLTPFNPIAPQFATLKNALE